MTFDRLANPLPMAAGYTVHLYCDRDRLQHTHIYFGEFYSQSKAAALKDAKRLGWIIRKDETATCPTCSGKVRGRR